MRNPPKILAITASYSENASGLYDGYDINGSAITLTLSSPATRGVRYLNNSGSSDATIATAGTSATIDGSTTVTLLAGTALTLVANGLTSSSANWLIVGSDSGESSGTGTITIGAIAGGDSSLGITGQAAAQGGAVVTTGGASSTATNAGGAVSQVGGTGNTSGRGGASSVTGGVGGSSGKGGAVNITGGAAGGGATDGGGVVLGGGAKSSTGFIGPVILGNAQLTPIWYPQAAPATDGADTPFTATVAQLVAGLISMTPTTGRAITTPTGAEMDAGVAFADIPATFGFDFTVQNRAAFAATDDIITLTAGATGVTITGSAVVAPGVAARFRAVRTTTATWIFYKIAG